MNESGLAKPTYVNYRNLSGGLNTRIAPQALQRNQLQQSVNCWYPNKSIIAKRPGSANISSGATTSGAACQGMVQGRYSTGSYPVVQTSNTSLWFTKFSPSQDANWTHISTAITTGGIIRAVQMFDPENGGSGTDSLIIVNGIDAPWVWKGPGTTTLATIGGTLPQNHTNAANITPKYVNTLLQRLFYSGEPTEPAAVYVSDPYFPRRFNLSASQSSGITAATYIPYLIGRNDGTNGGDITGIEPIYQSMLVYKQSAIYRMDDGLQILGDTYFSVTPVDVNVGALSPRSIVRFGSFHVFLGFDGVYITDGVNPSRKISYNVPHLFEGPQAFCSNRTTAVGVRYLNTYMIFFDLGAVGHNNYGAWFNFDVLDDDGYPTCGEISGMNVQGATLMAGPTDNGTVAWCSGTADVVAEFGGIVGSGISSVDPGPTNISSTFQTKSDYFAEEFDPAAPVLGKYLDNMYVYVNIPNAFVGNTITYSLTAFYDYFNIGTPFTATTPAAASVTGGVVGSAVVGTDVVGGPSTASTYWIAKGYFPNFTTDWHTASIQVNEGSANGWNFLGMDLYINSREIH